MGARFRIIIIPGSGEFGYWWMVWDWRLEIRDWRLVGCDAVAGVGFWVTMEAMDRNGSFIWGFLERWAPLIVWMALIFLLSQQPKGAIPSYGPWDLLVKKGAHFAAYGLLALLARWAGFKPWAALFLALAYAAGDELHQIPIPGRNGRVADVLIDGMGAATALALLPCIQARVRGLGRLLSLPAQSGRRDGSDERLSPRA